MNPDEVLELIARAMHEATWRTSTTEPPAWKQCPEWIRKEYRLDAARQLEQYRKEKEGE